MKRFNRSYFLWIVLVLFVVMCFIFTFGQARCSLNLMDGEERCSYLIFGIGIKDKVSKGSLIDSPVVVEQQTSIEVHYAHRLVSKRHHLHSGSRTALGRFLSVLKLNELDLNDSHVHSARTEFAEFLHNNPGDKFIELKNGSRILVLDKATSEDNAIWEFDLLSQ